MAGTGTNFEASTSGDGSSRDGATGATDPMANARYELWGGTGSQRESEAAASAGGAGNRNERLQYEDDQIMTLSGQDRQKIAAMWAQSNGADINDANAYTKTSLSDGGNTVAVGPFKLTAAMVMNDWANGMVNGAGLIDRGALDSYVRQGMISAQTAEMASSPEFMDFMQRLSVGGQMSPEEMQRFMPPDLQKAIAGDLINAGAAIVGMQGRDLTSGAVLDTVRGFDAQTGQMIDFGASPYADDGIYVPQDTRTNNGAGGNISYDEYGAPRNVWQQTESEGLEPRRRYDPDPDNIADRIPTTTAGEYASGQVMDPDAVMREQLGGDPSGARRTRR